MKLMLMFLLLLILMFSSTLSVEHGTCDQYQYSRGILKCQAEFYSRLGNSTDHKRECPSLYNQAVQCAKTTVFTRCYKDLGNETLARATEKGLDQFGTMKLYCHYGGLPSIFPVLNGTEGVKCKYANESTIHECENPFYNEFRSNPGSEKLCVLSSKTAECQVSLLSFCQKAIYAHKIPNTAHSTNARCKKVQEELLTAGGENRNGKNTKASEVHHPTSWDIITPVIVVGVLVFLALVVGFCYYSKQERRKNRKEKKENKKKINERAEQIKKNGANAEPRLKQGEELLPLSSVVHNEKEDISQV